MRYVYLHGFASSPQSRKACAFRKALAGRGGNGFNQVDRCRISLEVPDLAAGDFAHLTISGQLRLVESLLDSAPCQLIGSSMGGYLAALYASLHPEVERLVLLAPAFGFAPRWREMQGEEAIQRWRDTGWLEVFHYGDKMNRKIHYGLYEDAVALPAFPDFRRPAVIFHGVEDAVVPIAYSRQFAASHSNAELRELPSDHELLNVLDRIVTEGAEFVVG